MYDARAVRLLRLLLSRRGLLPALLVVGSIAISAVRASPVATLGMWALALFAIALAITAAHLEGVLAWSTFGAAVSLASLAGTGTDAPGYAWLDGAGFVGAALASFSAMRAISRTPGSEDGLTPSRASSGLVLGGALALTWLVGAVALGAPSTSLPIGLAWLAPTLTVMALLGHATVARFRRVLELHAEARLASAIAVAIITTIACASAFVAGARGLGAIARAVLPVACVAVAAVTTLGEPLAVWRLVRRASVLSAVGGVFALVMAIFAAEVGGYAPMRAPIVVVIAVAVAIVIGTQTRALEQLTAQESHGLLLAVDDARRRLLEAEPEDAIAVALTSMRSTHPGATPPELYSLAPARCAWADAAGYIHRRDAELPSRLIELASKETCGVLRTEVLEPLEVRRPDLRPLLAWLRDAGVLAAITVVRAGQVDGVLLLPRGNRRATLSLEEVTACSSLASSLGMALSTAASLARSHEREAIASTRAESESDRAMGFEHTLSLLQEQNRRATERLATPAAIGIYSASSRMAYDAALRRANAQAPVFVRAPSGVDPVPYLARAHLAGPRAQGPFVLVDCTSAREHDLSRWKDPKLSPIALADGGVLLLLDGPALPADVQQLIGQALAERRPPWERPQALDVVLAMSSASNASELIESHRLDATLAVRLGDALEVPVELPRLHDRPEDLRALVNDRLAREGLRLRGAPLGIEAAAFARLVEYPFNGEDAELAAICQQLAATCHGDVVRVVDVEKLGIAASVGDRPVPEGRGPRAVGR